MKQWYASVNYGLELAASEIIKSKGAENIQILDSALIFSCAHEINVKCINNLFLVLSMYSSKSIMEAAIQLSKAAGRLKFPILSGKTFRVIIMDCGKLRPIPNDIMSKIERSISRQTKLSVNRANPDVEIWLNRRNNDSVIFMLRLKKHPSFEKKLKKGELRPDIVDIMIYKAEINKDSVIADPFGGWGAIAVAVAESGRYKVMYTGDINDECVQHQKKRLSGKRSCFVSIWDACRLPLDDKSVDAVITDPPWGEYQQSDIASLYDAFICETARILRPDGSMVFLTSMHDEACQSLERYGFSYSCVPLKIGGKETFLFCAKNEIAIYGGANGQICYIPAKPDNKMPHRPSS